MGNKETTIDWKKIPDTMIVDGVKYLVDITECKNSNTRDKKYKVIHNDRIFFTHRKGNVIDYISFVKIDGEWVMGRCHKDASRIPVKLIVTAYDFIQEVYYTENEITEIVEENNSRWELMEV